MKRSLLEELFRSMLIMAGIKDFVEEHRFDKVRKWRFDFAWPQHMIACEVDGGTWMVGGGRHARTSDYEKRNAASDAGWRVYYYDASMVKSGAALAHMIKVMRGGV